MICDQESRVLRQNATNGTAPKARSSGSPARACPQAVWHLSYSAPLPAMQIHIPHLSLTFGAGQFVWRSRDGYKYHPTIFFGLVLSSLLTATVAFTPSYSEATQCGPFNVTWGGLNVTTGSPWVLLILPFDTQPVIVDLPDSSYNNATKIGNYMLDNLPLRGGIQFIVSMDDGNGTLFAHAILFRGSYDPSGLFLPTGRATGGISLIKTVGNSSDASCLTENALSTSSFFTLDPTIPFQCSPQTISWDSTRYQEPPTIRVLIPGGQYVGLDSSSLRTTAQLSWDVYIREGTQFVLLVEPALNQNISRVNNTRTSPLITVTGKSSEGDTCLNANSPSSTLILSSATATATPTSITALPGGTNPVP